MIVYPLCVHTGRNTMKQQEITVTTENTVYVPPLSDDGTYAFYSALLERLKILDNSDKSNKQ